MSDRVCRTQTQRPHVNGPRGITLFEVVLWRRRARSARHSHGRFGMFLPHHITEASDLTILTARSIRSEDSGSGFWVTVDKQLEEINYAGDFKLLTGTRHCLSIHERVAVCVGGGAESQRFRHHQPT